MRPQAEPQERPASKSRVRRGVSFAGATVSLALSCTGEIHSTAPEKPARVRPGPAPQGRPDAVSNASCVRCHADIAAEWSGSLHQRAWDDPTFLAAYAVEPLPFCRNCHAPEASDDEADPRRHEGVSCVTCHVLSRRVVGPRPSRNGPHPVLAAPDMATSEWCGGCHEFDFPRPQAAKMQRTVSEHAASQHAERPCQTCHMPVATDRLGRTYRRHDFRVQGNPAFIGKALSVTGRTIDDRRVEVSLRAAAVGHAVPTGDLYRRLVVRAVDAEGQAARPVVLSRRFVRVDHADGPERREVADERVPASGAPRHAELFFFSPFVLPVHWEVAYQRMGPVEAAVFGFDLEADESVVAKGVLTEEDP
ncbi:MAG: multiheme c-type cytochrome [Myxococcota bacterium]